MEERPVTFRIGEFSEQPCGICGRPALVRVGVEGAAEEPHYFCEEHVREAQALRSYFAFRHNK